MHVWRTTKSSKAEVYTHEVGAGFGHGLFAPLISHLFQVLRVSASVWERGQEWFAIHIEPQLTSIEAEYGKDSERGRYNERHLKQAISRREMTRGTHSGYLDLFAPIVVGEKVAGVLVTGPFAIERPTSAHILQHWRSLTGRQGHQADPEFATYLSATLGMLVLDGGTLPAFERLVGCLVRLMAGREPADAIMNEADVLRVELERPRFVERTWEAVDEMVDDRSAHRWHSALRATDLRRLGLSQPPDNVIVALMGSVKPDSDPVDDALRRDAFKRRAVELARTFGDVIAGRVGDHGVVFLSAMTGSSTRKRQKRMDLVKRASVLARRDFGLLLRCGAAESSVPTLLSRSYQTALAAAESALIQDIELVVTETLQSRPLHSLRHLRLGLTRAVEEQPELLAARFDRYLEAVALHAGHRIDAARPHLEVGFERMAEALGQSGPLDEKSLGALLESLDRAAGEARTLSDLFAAYRRAVADLSAAEQQPVAARHDRSLRGAEEYLRKHYTEPLTMKQLARVAGFAPNYFSELFHKRQGMTFTDYLKQLRVERAKHLLSRTSLNLARVAQLSGLTSRQYLNQVFRQELAQTPLRYRLSHQSRAKAAKRS